MKDRKSKESKRKVKAVLLRLEKTYGVPRKEGGGDPLDTLIQTILSQNTNDQNRDRAYKRLRARCPDWEDVLKVRESAVIEALRPGGLAKQKARRVREILRWVRKHYRRWTLLPLQERSSKEIEEALGGLKGVGPKTLHCFLLFGMGREAFPVDTHILRIGKRLGLIPEEMSAEKAHQQMAPLVPEKKSLSLHLNLIRFGRDICKARNPQCHACFLTDKCVRP